MIPASGGEEERERERERGREGVSGGLVIYLSNSSILKAWKDTF